jgi:hypothetical protein
MNKSTAAKKGAVLEARVLAGRLGDVLYEVERVSYFIFFFYYSFLIIF